MLFNSFGFLLVFLPLTVAGFFILARRSQNLAAGALGLASLIFYGWWSYQYIPLLLGSIVFNYAISSKIGASEQPTRRHWLVLGICINLGFLGYYKYANFLVESVNWLSSVQLQALNIVLPIGISFFTFTQIAFLVDTYQNKVSERRFVHYLLFVTYFPHLIAGPVLHHKEMMPQFGDSRNYTPHASNFAIGLSFFVIGLAKKVLIADNLAPYANSLFGQAAAPDLVSAWTGVLAYSFQLYFDFSGYSDMAIGLSKIFGVNLPLNFNSPYKASNISEFWHRWHMSLSRFLRDYLYIPLGGNRHGERRRRINLMTTMVLGGLWHGAGLNFLIWGGLHGLFLIVHQSWASLPARQPHRAESAAGRFAAVALTFLVVCLAWVFFRASDPASATRILAGMFGLNGLGARLPELETSVYILGSALLVFALPNSQEIVERVWPFATSDNAVNATQAPHAANATPSRMRVMLRTAFPFALGLTAALALMNLSRPTEFLYFNF
jgi:D-alanyl-lipoteichoic acid acyltransferase DltB (MBOAT superfamily)